ncbi:MAG: DUF1361 domain-containing protein [Candidatus Saccharimonadales bacterium]
MRTSKTKQSSTILLKTLAVSSLVSIAFLLARMVATGKFTYWFLAWNLLLGWLPLGFSWWLIHRLKTRRWAQPGNILLTLLWLGFLPNAFYIASDIIHLKNTGNISVLYDVVMFLSFTFNGFVLGYVSLYSLQRQLKKRYGPQPAFIVAYVVLFLCSFAIYLGRYLRWNSWDILLNPAGLIFDVSEPFVNPGSHPQVFTTTLMFFVLLSSIYAVSYKLVQLAKDLPE